MIFGQNLSRFPPEGVVERRIIGIKLEATGGKGEPQRAPHISHFSELDPKRKCRRLFCIGKGNSETGREVSWVGVAPPCFPLLRTPTDCCWLTVSHIFHFLEASEVNYVVFQKLHGM